MGSIISKWWWREDPDQLDPISGLSKRDVHQIQQAWVPIYSKAGDNGLALFIRSFRTDIAIKRFFNLIKDMNEEQIVKNHRFRAHAINSMSSFNMIIMNLDQPAVVIPMLEKLGEVHGRLKIPPKYFDQFRNDFVDFLVIDRKLKPAVLTSFSRLMLFMYKHIIDYLSEN